MEGVSPPLPLYDKESQPQILLPKVSQEILAELQSRGNDGRKVFKIAQTPAFVAASMAPGWELDTCCTDESTDP
jgi:hypothetical protein